MHSLKLTVLVEDGTDLDMEVRVVSATVPGASVSTIQPRIAAVTTEATHADDDYVLGGYAGI
jgi:hypothetical protein